MCLNYLHETTTHDEPLLFFVSPDIIKEQNQYWNKYSYRDNYAMLDNDVLKSPFLTHKRLEQILDRTISKKEFNEFKKEEYNSKLYKEIEDNFNFIQGRILGHVQFKAGTKIKAWKYDFIGYRTRY